MIMLLMIHSTGAITRALAAAAQTFPAHSRVLFPAGRWYLQPPLLIPDGVTIAGDSMSTTALFFAQNSGDSGPSGTFMKPDPAFIPALIGPKEPPTGAVNSTVTFAVEDLCIYALSFYSTVINISTATSNVRVKRVRIRANAFSEYTYTIHTTASFQGHCQIVCDLQTAKIQTPAPFRGRTRWEATAQLLLRCKAIVRRSLDATSTRHGSLSVPLATMDPTHQRTR